MDKKLLKEAAKQAWYYVLAYFTNYLMPILKETFKKTKDYFINLLWDSLKEEFSANVKSAVEFVDRYFNSLSYKEKEKDVIDTLFKNAKFPVLLRPFKPLLKKILKDKLHEFISKHLKALNSKF